MLAICHANNRSVTHNIENLMNANLADEHRKLQRRYQSLRDEMASRARLVADLFSKIEAYCSERDVIFNEDIYLDLDDIISRSTR